MVALPRAGGSPGMALVSAAATIRRPHCEVDLTCEEGALSIHTGLHLEFPKSTLTKDSAKWVPVARRTYGTRSDASAWPRDRRERDEEEGLP